MHCYICDPYSNVFYLMYMKMSMHYSLLQRLISYKVCLCFIVLRDMVCVLLYYILLYVIVINFVGITSLWILLNILCMIIYEALYT